MRELSELPPALSHGLEETLFFSISRIRLKELALAAVSHVQEHKLSGQVLKRRSGDLATKWDVNRARQGAYKIELGGSKVPYAAAHEFGVTIRPKRAKVLRFQVNGRWVSTRMVRIPARPYFKPGIEEFFRSGRASRIADGAFREYSGRVWGAA